MASYRVGSFDSAADGSLGDLRISGQQDGAVSSGGCDGKASPQARGWTALIRAAPRTRGTIRVHGLVTAVDCGTWVNPAAVEAQTEGGRPSG